MVQVWVGHDTVFPPGRNSTRLCHSPSAPTEVVTLMGSSKSHRVATRKAHLMPQTSETGLHTRPQPATAALTEAYWT